MRCHDCENADIIVTPSSSFAFSDFYCPHCAYRSNAVGYFTDLARFIFGNSSVSPTHAVSFTVNSLQSNSFAVFVGEKNLVLTSSVSSDSLLTYIKSLRDLKVFDQVTIRLEGIIPFRHCPICYGRHFVENPKDEVWNVTCSCGKYFSSSTLLATSIFNAAEFLISNGRILNNTEPQSVWYKGNLVFKAQYRHDSPRHLIYLKDVQDQSALDALREILPEYFEIVTSNR